MRIACLAAVQGSGLLGCHSTPANPTPSRPNVIYMLADDWGYRELGAYGQSKIRTPHLDRMAAEGVKFTQHYSGSPVCAPSRAALLTGLHTGHGVVKDNLELGDPSRIAVPRRQIGGAQHDLPAYAVTH